MSALKALLVAMGGWSMMPPAQRASDLWAIAYIACLVVIAVSAAYLVYVGYNAITRFVPKSWREHNR